jgi:hypothetical protein
MTLSSFLLLLLVNPALYGFIILLNKTLLVAADVSEKVWVTQ